jgi:hypothetical protein
LQKKKLIKVTASERSRGICFWETTNISVSVSLFTLSQQQLKGALFLTRFVRQKWETTTARIGILRSLTVPTGKPATAMHRDSACGNRHW